MKEKVNIFWFRRDLRLEDNTGLYHALNSALPVIPLFIYDTDILGKLENKSDARVEFINKTIIEINAELKSIGSSFLTVKGNPVDVWKKLVTEYDISEVFLNHDYEPAAVKRDKSVEEFLNKKGIKFNSYKDQVIFEKNEVTKSDGKPYTIFTPYSKTWLDRLKKEDIKVFSSEKLKNNFLKLNNKPLLLEDIGFKRSGILIPPKEINKSIISNYENTRDIPSVNGTTKLSIHLRFGTLSIRQLVRSAVNLNDTWLKELIWREFFMMILHHFPYSAVTSFRHEYDKISWRNDEEEFNAWCNGKTGFPIVDAGMRELNATGFMHNRVRMITASFLCKDLLIDWRWGERYFAEKLLDYELSSNVGNWQWAAGTGCDAAPYFRIFNPLSQQQKFDPELIYIKKWIPELDTLDYPAPIVDHKFARERTLTAYKKALNRNS